MKHHLVRLATAGALLLAGAGAAITASTPAAAYPQLTFVSAMSAYDSASPKEALAECPSGTRILGGGGYIYMGGRRVHLTRLQALGSSDRFAAGATEDGPYNSSWRVHAYGICGPAPAGLQYVSYHTGTDSSTYKEARADCPRGKKLLSAGYRVYGANGNAVATDFQPSAFLGQVLANAEEDENGFLGKWSFWGYGVCANEWRGLERVDASSPNTSDDHVATVSCPLGKQLFGLGATIGGLLGHGQAHYVAAYPDGGLTTVTVIALEDETGTDDDWWTTVIAICG